MNAKLITDQAILHKGMSIDFLYAKRYINEAMHLLAARYDDACVYLNKTITCTDTADYHALDENYGVVKVADSNGDKYTDYNIEFNSIMFKDEGVYIVTQLTVATDIIAEASIPEVHSVYHYPIAFYVAGKDLDRLKPGDGKANTLLSSFFVEADIAHARLGRPKRRGMRMPAPAWR